MLESLLNNRICSLYFCPLFRSWENMRQSENFGGGWGGALSTLKSVIAGNQKRPLRLELKGKPRQMRLAREFQHFGKFSQFLADCRARSWDRAF